MTPAQVDMRGIEPLPSGRYRVRVQRKKKKIRPKVCDTLQEAIDLRAAIDAEVSIAWAIVTTVTTCPVSTFTS